MQIICFYTKEMDGTRDGTNYVKQNKPDSRKSIARFNTYAVPKVKWQLSNERRWGAT